MTARAPLGSALALALLLPASAGCSRNPPLANVVRPADSSSVLAIRPGDVVKVQVWQHEELSGDFPVDENYNLLFPVIGEINVREMAVGELRERLRAELGRLFTQPFVTVIPLFRVAVIGEVVRPGLYSVDPTLNVFDLLAVAGGPTSMAKQDRIQLVRGGEQIRVSLDPAAVARATLRELGVRSGDQLLVPRKAITRDEWGILLQLVNTVLLAYTIFR